VGAEKHRISVGNHDATLDMTFEAWLDDVAIGESRLPWVREDDQRSLRELQPLQPDTLPEAFSFVFGSCSNSNHVPAKATALAAASELDADFVLHLGDLGYVDSSAYAQTVNGYLASWNDLLASDHMSRLADRPWVRICSDHDLGGNNVVATTVAPFAAEAFTKYHANDRSADGEGRYGSMALDGGRILLVWTEGVLFRSNLENPDAPDNTKLGEAQLKWLLDLLASAKDAKLILLATETPFGQQSNTSWTNHPRERKAVLDAVHATGAQVRILSGDLHHAAWARLSDTVVEWGAAAMSEFPEGRPRPASDVLDSGSPDYRGYKSRPKALENMTIDEFNATTTYGFCGIDTRAGTATFELRGPDGQVRVDELGRPMTETFTYA
jgi:hypothetical protein